jgi:hypothetical protein
MLIRRRRTALSKTPHALADGLMLAFQHPVDWASRSWGLFPTPGAADSLFDIYSRNL